MTARAHSVPDLISWLKENENNFSDVVVVGIWDKPRVVAEIRATEMRIERLAYASMVLNRTTAEEL